MPSSCVTYTPLWSGIWQAGSIGLSQPASAFDAIRFVKFPGTLSGDTVNSGQKECFDVATSYPTFSINQGFCTSNSWFHNNFCLQYYSGYERVSGRSSQRTYLQSGSNYSGSFQYFGCVSAFGIKYHDTSEYDTGKIYGDRTLIYSGADSSGKVSCVLTEPTTNFTFIEVMSNNPRPNAVFAGDARKWSLTGFLQADTHWYYRGTVWEATNTGRSAWAGGRFVQAALLTGNYSMNQSGNVPAPYQRNVQPITIWGIGRK